MLRELHIKDFAIIDELRLSLAPGLNILTGETGAGKSILIDAVALLLGDRANITAIRSGATRALVEGWFWLSPARRETLASLLEREGLESDAPDELWLSRELRSSGRTISRVNGRGVSLAILREVAEGLVDIHGQGEHLSLLRVREHVRLLDRFAGLESQREQLAAQVSDLQKARRTLEQLRASERTRMQRIDLLRFQVEEIHAAQLTPGEQTNLEAERVRLAHAEQLAARAAKMIAILTEGEETAPSVVDLLGQAQREMSVLCRIDSSLTTQQQTLAEAEYQIEDVAGFLQNYLDGLEFNPQRLTQVEERLALLRQLERKYGGNETDVLAYAEAAEQELVELEHSDEQIEALVEEEAHLLRQCAKASQQLSEQRQIAAQQLASELETELADLRMGGAQFGVIFRRKGDPQGLAFSTPVPTEVLVTAAGIQVNDPTPLTAVSFDSNGMEQVEFVIAPNVGEGLKPLTRIASGGETARLMLALKTVLSRADQTPTLIFDEVDQGIGGRIGAVVGAKLWLLTRNHGDTHRHQVLCITHLPQLAGFGDVHLQVRKQTENGRTKAIVTQLEGDARITELGNMLGTQGEAARKGAQDILQQARILKERHLSSKEKNQ